MGLLMGRPSKPVLWGMLLQNVGVLSSEAEAETEIKRDRELERDRLTERRRVRE